MNIFKTGIVALLAVATMTSCKDEPNKTEAEAAKTEADASAAAVKYMAVADQSNIMWTGSKPTGKHTGTISIENGTMSVKEGIVESGTFLIDMNSIKATDMDAEGNANLEAHLKGLAEDKKNDFFNVADYPTATFTVTGNKQQDGVNHLEGNLTLKGVKKNVSFPYTVTADGDMATFKSEAFTIDRTDWGIKYGSGTFFDDLGDKTIDDDMVIQFEIKAKKA